MTDSGRNGKDATNSAKAESGFALSPTLVGFERFAPRLVERKPGILTRMESDGALLTAVRKWRDTLRIMRICCSGSRTRSRLVYELLGDDNLMCRNSLYVNLGYWEKARNLDQACQDLAEKVGIVAELAPDDHVLDAGCGFGDQDIYWVERFSPRKITAINIT